MRKRKFAEKEVGSKPVVCLFTHGGVGKGGYKVVGEVKPGISD